MVESWFVNGPRSGLDKKPPPRSHLWWSKIRSRWWETSLLRMEISCSESNTNLSWSLSLQMVILKHWTGRLFKTVGRSRRWNHKFRCLFGRRYWNPLLFLRAGCKSERFRQQADRKLNGLCLSSASYSLGIIRQHLELADTTRSWFSKGSSDYKLWSYPRFVPPVTVYRSIWDPRRADHPATGCH